jgi:hypothetical protein
MRLFKLFKFTLKLENIKSQLHYCISPFTLLSQATSGNSCVKEGDVFSTLFCLLTIRDWEDENSDDKQC